MLPIAAQHITQARWDELRKRGVAALRKSIRRVFLKAAMPPKRG